MSQAMDVLRASVHDLRHFAALLRGVGFGARATVTVTDNGLVVIVEEARTLLATAYIFSDIFDEYEYHPEPSSAPPSPPPASSPTDGEFDPPPSQKAGGDTSFELPLGTLIDCLNIFGTAGAAATTSQRLRRWPRDGEESDQEGGGGGRGERANGHADANANGAGASRIEQYFGGGTEKGTGMRLSYAGAGFPVTLLIAEDAGGPTATCEITTFDPEPHLELPFDAEDSVLKIILKSSWLRDALSELDPSSDKLTFIGNPPGAVTGARRATKPMLRIQAKGSFGSTEMDYPNDREVLETFECDAPVSFSYRFAHIARTLRALGSSTKTSLRIERAGLLSLQFLMPAPRAASAQREQVRRMRSSNFG